MRTRDLTRTIENTKPLSGFRLHILWEGGVGANVSLASILSRKALLRLKDETYFARAELGDWGHSVTWPCGEEIGADWLWLETLTETGHSDARTFLEWRVRNALSLNKAADALGLSRRMVAYYSNGEKRVPKHVLLALRGWEAEQTRSATSKASEAASNLLLTPNPSRWIVSIKELEAQFDEHFHAATLLLSQSVNYEPLLWTWQSGRLGKRGTLATTTTTPVTARVTEAPVETRTFDENGHDAI